MMPVRRHRVGARPAAGVRAILVGVCMASALWACLLGAGARPASAQEWGGPTPAQGDPGSTASVGGNLIGCYGSGPGELSSTWGFPDRVVLYFDGEVRASDDTFIADLLEDPSGVSGMEELASHSFGEAGWTLDFTVPDAEPGPHVMVLAFEPQCNYKSVEAPDGYTDEPSISVLSFCITEDGVCPPATPAVDPFLAPVTDETDDEPEPGIVVAVGTAAAVAAAVAAAAAAAPPTGDGEDADLDLSIVQVSRDQITVTAGRPETLVLTGWHAGEGGNLKRVAMELSIDVPPASGLAANPTSGIGEVVVELSVDASTFDPANRQLILTARGQWDGLDATADITVELVDEMQLEWI